MLGCAEGAAQALMKQGINVEVQSKPQRHRVELPVALHRGDFVDFIVHPRANHDCDGVFMIDVQVMPKCQSGTEGMRFHIRCQLAVQPSLCSHTSACQIITLPSEVVITKRTISDAPCILALQIFTSCHPDRILVNLSLDCLLKGGHRPGCATGFLWLAEIHWCVCGQ